MYHAGSTSFGGHQQAVTRGDLNQLLDAGGGDLADRERIHNPLRRRRREVLPAAKQRRLRLSDVLQPRVSALLTGSTLLTTRATCRLAHCACCAPAALIPARNRASVLVDCAVQDEVAEHDERKRHAAAVGYCAFISGGFRTSEGYRFQNICSKCTTAIPVSHCSKCVWQ